MARLKFLYVVACTTVLTLLLQLVMIYNKQSYLSKSANLLPSLESFLPKRNLTQPLSRSFKGYSDVVVTTRTSMTRIQRRLAVGIPTIKRKDGDYFMNMLTSMLNITTDKQLKEVVFVIFLADLNNTDWKIHTEKKIRETFPDHVQSGSLEVIKAPASFYKTMPTFGKDSYMNWRTKQNYDYAFLMKYCADIAELYMQMEDDVVASNGYFDAIMDYVRNQTDNSWICLEFSELGFIGKLYHSRDIKNLASMLLMFNATQPVDYTYLYFNMLMGSGLRKLRKPTLFQHLGVKSSLAEKVQPLRDKYFDFPAKIWNGDNPSATIFTTLKENEDFATNLPYLKSPGHFWSYEPGKENDTYLIVFDSPHLLSKIVVETGSRDYPGDIIRNGVVEASATISGSGEKPTCNDFIMLGKFEDGKTLIDDKQIKIKLGQVKVKCLQLRLTESQYEWVIIKEIAVFLSRA